jgi:hypothetical protein
MPQPPQLLPSYVTSMHAPLQIADPGGQSVHWPSEQYGVAPPHALPHAPQCKGSK